MERLSALDAEFLYLEDDATHMHIGGACVFDGSPPSVREVERLVAARLHLVPRYRQRVVGVPLDLGRPLWVDDPRFDLEHHVRGVALPHPGGDAAFCRLVGELMSRPLDRGRPLWEIWVVEGLERGRWALVCKVHHCMVDGVAGIGLLTTVLRPEPDAVVGEPEPWAFRPEPPTVCRVLDAWGGAVAQTAHLLRGAADGLVHPGATATTVVGVSTGALRFLARLTPTRRLSIEGPIGPHRVWAHASASLADVATIRQAFGGTVNDVVLAAVAGGYRNLLVRHGDDVARAHLRSLVPVSIPPTRGGARTGNRLAALLCDLPVTIADPVDRLRRVHDEMVALKSGHLVEAGAVAVAAADLTPPMVLGDVTRCAIRVMHRLGQPSLNTVTTNVAGPPDPLYCLGREMLEYLPFVPICHGLRVGTAIVSYHGRICFGVTGDEDSVRDVDVVAEGAVTSIGNLHRRALAHLDGDRHA